MLVFYIRHSCSRSSRVRSGQIFFWWRSNYWLFQSIEIARYAISFEVDDWRFFSMFQNRISLIFPNHSPNTDQSTLFLFKRFYNTCKIRFYKKILFESDFRIWSQKSAECRLRAIVLRLNLNNLNDMVKSHFSVQ